MVGAEGVLEVRVLHRHGKSIREIARDTGGPRNTGRRYHRDDEATRYKPRPVRTTQTQEPPVFCAPNYPVIETPDLSTT